MQFDSQEDQDLMELKVDHHSVEQRLERLSAPALKGFCCTIKDGKHYSCQLKLMSYIEDLPEAKDIVSMKKVFLPFSFSHLLRW